MFRFARPFAVAVASFLLISSTASAALVVADFNDVTVGSISGKAGGTGFLDPSTWAGGTSQVTVVTANLSAPAGTNYNLTQSGTAQKLRSINAANRVVHRALSATQGGEIWGSFLINIADANANAVVGFNNSNDAAVDTLGFMQSLSVEGGNLVYRTGNTVQSSATAVVPTGQTALILFRITYSLTDPNKGFSAWVNPDLLQPLPAPALFSLTIGNANVQKLSIGGRGNGEIDMVHMNNGATAFTDVTGQPMVVPEPATMGLITAGTLMVLPWRRGRE